MKEKRSFNETLEVFLISSETCALIECSQSVPCGVALTWILDVNNVPLSFLAKIQELSQ